MTARKFQKSIFVIVLLFIILSFALNLTPVIAAPKFTITVTQGTNGQISPGTSTVDRDNSKTFAIDPDTGYSIDSLIVDGSRVTVASSYTFSNVQADHTITATFAINNYTLTVVQGTNGVISPGTTVVSYGGNQTFNITPDTGYSIDSLIVDGLPVTVASSYTFSNVVAAHTITATYANKFRITVVQGSNGVISPGTTNVNYGDSSSFTVTPNSGYSIASLIVDGSSVAAASSYTFNNVVAGHTISATFSITTTPTPTPTPTSTATPTTSPTATIRPTSTPSPAPSKTPEPVPLHDITISQITPSASKVQVGQPLNFEVTIKNRGTASETFNVILYGNDTVIGEQTIVAMASNAEKKLSFQWDTSGFAKESVYSIKAITSEIKNDSDPENNISTFNYVQLAENLAIPIGLGVLGGTTWIYLAIGLGGGFTAAGLLVIKKRKPKSPDYEVQNENSKSFQGINDITEGAFPEAYSIMIVGGADSEKSAFCQQLANGYLKQGKPVLYISYDQFPEEIRTNMKELGWDISSHEQEGNFTFLDAYSSIGGKPSKEKFFVKQPFALSELGIGMSLTLNAFGKNAVKVFLDSTSPLFTRIDPSKVVEFLQDRIAKVKAENAMFFFTVGKGTIQENFLRRLEEMVDCVIELEVQKEKKKIVRRVQFKKLRGQKQPSFDIFVDTTDELTLSLLKNPNKNHK